MEAFTGPFQAVHPQENQPPRFNSAQISGFDFGLQLSSLSGSSEDPKRAFFLDHEGTTRQIIVDGVFKQETNPIDPKVRLLGQEVKEGHDPFRVLLEFTASHEPLATSLAFSTMPVQQRPIP